MAASNVHSAITVDFIKKETNELLTMKLKKLLKEYEDVRWLKQPDEQRFLFSSDAERFQFLLRLNELNAEYYLYEDKVGYKVEVLVV